jgi:hypothetical protein
MVVIWRYYVLELIFSVAVGGFDDVWRWMQHVPPKFGFAYWNGFRVTTDGVWICNRKDYAFTVQQFYSSLAHIWVLNLLFLHQSSGSGVQRWTFASPGLPDCPSTSATAILDWLTDWLTDCRRVLHITSRHERHRKRRFLVVASLPHSSAGVPIVALSTCCCGSMLPYRAVICNRYFLFSYSAVVAWQRV